MCGIVGYVGHKNSAPILIDGLRRLEYRGYDSAGIALVDEPEIETDRGLGPGELVQAERDDAVARAEISNPLPGEVEMITGKEVDDLLRRAVVVVVEPRDVDGSFHRAQANRRCTPGSDRQHRRARATARRR